MAEKKAGETAEQPKGRIDELADLFKFKVTTDKSLRIEFYEFEDGRKYKFQNPKFLEIHETILNASSPRHGALEIFLTHLYPENEKSPKIDDDYLSKNPNEGFALWSPLSWEAVFRD